MTRTEITSAFAATGRAVLLVLAAGCGGPSAVEKDPEPIPVYNPDPKNPLKDVGLENESKNLGRIQDASKPVPK